MLEVDWRVGGLPDHYLAIFFRIFRRILNHNNSSRSRPWRLNFSHENVRVSCALMEKQSKKGVFDLGQYL